MKKFLALVLVLMASDIVADTATWAISGNVVLTHQEPSDSGIRDETAGSTDLFLQRDQGTGSWVAHIEASTTPQSGGVSALLPEANADVGTALDGDGEGRLQLSELYYAFRFPGKRTLSLGLIDVSAFFEQSRIASDENTQFLGAFFVANPTIEFPDYSLGLVYEDALSQGFVLRAAVTSAKGLADNRARSYSQLLSVDDREGAFAIASASWEDEHWLLRAGLWLNASDHQALDGSSTDKDNYGAYVLAGYERGRHAVNFRYGAANRNVSRGARFASLAYRYQSGPVTFGAGVARAFLSSEEPLRELDDTDQYELYVDWALTENIFLTADLQRITNSSYGSPTRQQDGNANVYGVRMTWLYE